MNINKKIIAIQGLPGSGKSEAINYLNEKYKWPKVYFGEVTFDEMKRQNLEINEVNEKKTREGLREKYGLLHYAKQTIKKLDRLNSPMVLVESLYSWEEYLAFKEKFRDNFITIAIYTSPATRYTRLAKRPERPLTKKDAQSRDYSQIKNISQAGAIAMSNYTIINDKDLDNLHQELEKIINEITN